MPPEYPEALRLVDRAGEERQLRAVHAAGVLLVPRRNPINKRPPEFFLLLPEPLIE